MSCSNDSRVWFCSAVAGRRRGQSHPGAFAENVFVLPFSQLERLPVSRRRLGQAGVNLLISWLLLYPVDIHSVLAAFGHAVSMGRATA